MNTISTQIVQGLVCACGRIFSSLEFIESLTPLAKKEIPQDKQRAHNAGDRGDSATSDVIDNALCRFITTKKQEELDRVIADNNLKPLETREFMNKAFMNDVISDLGNEFGDILLPFDMFADSAKHRREDIFMCLSQFFERFRGFKFASEY